MATGGTIDALDDNILAELFASMRTPRDAMLLASVNTRMRRVELNARYSSLHATTADTAALGWLRARASRVARARIDCSNARMEGLIAAHKLARAMPRGSAVLNMGSHLFDEIHAMLCRDDAGMTALLERHADARLGGASKDTVRELESQILQTYGYDTDHDPLARASFAWNCYPKIETGTRDQLELTLHMWQGADEEGCAMHLEVRRRSNNELLERSARVIGERTTSDWWLEAASLYDYVKGYEFKDVDDDDEVSSNFDDDDDDDE